MKEFKYTKIWWLAFVLIITIGCQRDDEIPFEEPKSESRMVVPAEDIPEVTSTLLAKMGLRDDAKLFSANTSGAGNLEIDWEQVMQLVDSTGQKTYTFAIADEDDDPFTFFNLVMKYSALGDAYEPFLMKYSMHQDFIPEYLATGSLENFRGTVKKIALTSTSSTSGGYSRAAPSEDRGGTVGEDDSCPGTTVGSGGNDGGGGDTPPDSNNPPTGGGLSCTTYMVTNTWYSQACGGGVCEEPIVTGRNSSVVTVCNREGDIGEAGGEGESDCDPDEGEIPILEPRKLEDQIDDSQLKPCMQTLVADMKKLTKGMHWVLQTFDKSSNDPFLSSFLNGYNWNLMDASLTGYSALTSSTYNHATKSVTTRFDSNKFKDATDISVVRTILHEAVHSFLIAHQKVSISDMNKDYFELLQTYGNGSFNNLQDAQHVEFIRNWLDQIANSLQEYGISKGYSHSYQFYKDMAWGGLTDRISSNGSSSETPWFQFFVPNSNDRKRIKDNLAIEQSGKDAQGNSKTQKGAKSGC